MKTKSLLTLSGGLVATCALFLPLDAAAQSGEFRSGGGETARDLPGSAHKYYGMRVSGHFRDPKRRIAKTDLDADLNYDGIIDNQDPADNGLFEVTPPGLQIGVGEMTRLILRIRPYRLDFDGQAIVSISIDGINRAAKSGLFTSLEEEVASTGRVRVWSDAARTNLLLDSADPDRRVYEWVMDRDQYFANLPGTVPRTIFAEGISPSGRYLGDVRLLLMIQHRDGDSGGGHVTDEPMTSKSVVPEAETSEPTSTGIKRFSTSYDHMLITVRTHPQRKDFVIDNSGVWIPPSGSKGGK